MAVMSHSKLGLLIAASVIVVACGDDRSKPNPFGHLTTSDTDPSMTTSSGPLADETATATDGDPQGIELGPCGRLANCLDAIDQAITPFLAIYGPEGTCWSEFTTEQCWQDCRSMFSAYTTYCDDTEACCECTTLEHCAYDPTFQHCVDDRCEVQISEIYSSCDSNEDCIGLDVCATFESTSLGGFCTNHCSTSTDCPSSPPGVATCNLDDVCALQCSEYLSCPPMMDCHHVGDPFGRRFCVPTR